MTNIDITTLDHVTGAGGASKVLWAGAKRAGAAGLREAGDIATQVAQSGAYDGLRNWWTGGDQAQAAK